MRWLARSRNCCARSSRSPGDHARESGGSPGPSGQRSSGRSFSCETAASGSPELAITRTRSSRLPASRVCRSRGKARMSPIERPNPRLARVALIFVAATRFVAGSLRLYSGCEQLAFKDLGGECLAVEKDKRPFPARAGHMNLRATTAYRFLARRSRARARSGGGERICSIRRWCVDGADQRFETERPAEGCAAP